MSDQRANSNRLADEHSPYLRLHANNPVDWYPWSAEALDRARREDRPIFLSIGYSTCFWCHVMERESFSDPGIAAFMNEHFVNIKVDREERPDLDEIYMAATQAYAGQGGWPNSLFLTPDLAPYFAGTYFPPEPRHGMPSFTQVLEAMASAWSNRREDVQEQAKSVEAAVRHYLEDRGRPSPKPPGSEPFGRSLEALGQAFDPEWGGFGGAPKFPTPGNLLVLLEAARDQDEAALHRLSVTLDRMARGGIFDQLAGGFHRYATDRAWRVPHFEKMLYDNGLLLEIYGRTHALTRDPQAARVCRSIVSFLNSEMRSPEGGFWSALDAETAGREGAYYVWTREELLRVLGEEDFGFVAPLWGFSEAPFFEEHGYVLHIPQPLEDLARRRRKTVDELLSELEPHRRKLLEVRSARKRPATDDKILADWNGLVTRGLAIAGEALGDESMIEAARSTARFLLKSMRVRGELHHVWHRGSVAVPAVLTDYVFVIAGLLELHRITREPEWLTAALELRSEQQERLGDADGGFFTAAAASDLLARSREIFDGAVPSGNGQAALNDLELAELTGEKRWRRRAEQTLCAFSEPIEQRPEGARLLALAAYRLTAASGSEDGPGQGEAHPDLLEEASNLIAAKLSIHGGGAESWQAFDLQVEVAAGWHIYPPQPESGEGRQTVLEGGPEVELRNVRWPEATVGREHGQPVYDGRLSISGELSRRSGVEVALRMRAHPCDASRCVGPIELLIRP